MEENEICAKIAVLETKIEMLIKSQDEIVSNLEKFSDKQNKLVLQGKGIFIGAVAMFYIIGGYGKKVLDVVFSGFTNGQ